MGWMSFMQTTETVGYKLAMLYSSSYGKLQAIRILIP